MTSIEIANITGLSYPYQIYVCDVFGNQCVLIATINTSVPPSTNFILPSQFDNAPAVGVKITATGITFSAPNVGLRRIVTVKKGKSIPISTLVAAAGLKNDPRAKNAKVTLSAKLKKSFALAGKSVKTTQKGAFEIPFTYKDASKKSITKMVKIVVK